MKLMRYRRERKIVSSKLRDMTSFSEQEIAILNVEQRNLTIVAYCPPWAATALATWSIDVFFPSSHLPAFLDNVPFM